MDDYIQTLDEDKMKRYRNMFDKYRDAANIILSENPEEKGDRLYARLKALGKEGFNTPSDVTKYISALNDNTAFPGDDDDDKIVKLLESDIFNTLLNRLKQKKEEDCGCGNTD